MGTDDEDELSDDELDQESASDAETDQSESEEDHMTDSDQSETSNGNAKTKESGISTISLDSLKEDIAKGKAAKHQLGRSRPCC